jgi:hypothetical protein
MLVLCLGLFQSKHLSILYVVIHYLALLFKSAYMILLFYKGAKISYASIFQNARALSFDKYEYSLGLIHL